MDSKLSIGINKEPTIEVALDKNSLSPSCYNELIHLSAKALTFISPKSTSGVKAVSKISFVVIGTESGPLLIPKLKYLKKRHRRVSSFLDQEMMEEMRTKNEVNFTANNTETQQTKKQPVTPPTRKKQVVPMAPHKKHTDYCEDESMEEIHS
jgi:hypothetical protein